MVAYVNKIFFCEFQRVTIGSMNLKTEACMFDHGGITELFVYSSMVWRCGFWHIRDCHGGGGVVKMGKNKPIGNITCTCLLHTLTCNYDTENCKLNNDLTMTPTYEQDVVYKKK